MHCRIFPSIPSYKLFVSLVDILLPFRLLSSRSSWCPATTATTWCNFFLFLASPWIPTVFVSFVPVSWRCAHRRCLLDCYCHNLLISRMQIFSSLRTANRPAVKKYSMSIKSFNWWWHPFSYIKKHGNCFINFSSFDFFNVAFFWYFIFWRDNSFSWQLYTNDSILYSLLFNASFFELHCLFHFTFLFCCFI